MKEAYILQAVLKLGNEKIEVIKETLSSLEIWEDIYLSNPKKLQVLREDNERIRQPIKCKNRSK